MIRLSQTSAFSWNNCSVDTVYHLRFSKHPTFTVNGVVKKMLYNAGSCKTNPNEEKKLQIMVQISFND
jgi:hypothetical protein